MGLQGGTTTGLHIHQGSATATGSVLVDPVLAAGASSIAFTEPVSGMETLTSSEVAIFNAGALNVNLHSSTLLSGEIRGQLTDTGRALVENIPSGGVVSGRNFDNMSTAPPPEGVPDDNCSCIIGIFETDNTHDWELVWTGATTSSMVATALKVATVSVNSSESGTIVVTIKDENSATTTITVTHPTTLGDENAVEQPLLLIPGKRYPFTVAYTGNAHHYKLGSKDKYLAIGQEDISCLEGVEQDWTINVESGEVVKLTFTTDSSSNGVNQTGPVQDNHQKRQQRHCDLHGRDDHDLNGHCDNSDRWRQRCGRNVDSGTGRSRRPYTHDERLRQRPVLLHRAVS